MTPFQLARMSPITRFMPGRYVINPLESESIVPPRYSTAFSALRYNPANMVASYNFHNGWKTYMRAIPNMQMQIWRNSPSLGRYYNYFLR